MFAVVLDILGIGLLGGEADASAVLPCVADLALHEEAGQLVGDLDGEDAFVVNCVLDAVLRVLVKGRRARVLVVAADAADGLVVLLDVVGRGRHADDVWPGQLVAVVVLAAGAATSKDGVLGGGRVLGRLGRERPGAGGLLGRPGLGEAPGGSIDSSGNARCGGGNLRLGLGEPRARGASGRRGAGHGSEAKRRPVSRD